MDNAQRPARFALAWHEAQRTEGEQVAGESLARDRATRVADTQAKLAGEVDVWVSSASEDGRGFLVPLS